MKEKVLNQARLLYNKLGLSKVTARIICEEMKISLGSFSYHFPDKKGIISALYHEMLEEINQVYQSFQDNHPGIITYLDSHKALFLIQEKYKFLHLNLFEILKNNTEIKEIYDKKRAEEIRMAEINFKSYAKNGVFKKNVTDEQIKRLISVGLILNNFWPIDAEISPKVNQNQRLVHYMKICCGLLEPHLETESLEQYKDYFQEMENSI